LGQVKKLRQTDDEAAPGVLVDAAVPRLYTIPDAAKLFTVSADWFYDGIRDGEIHVTDLARNRDPASTRKKWRVSAAELHRLIETRTQRIA
jgi:hypothetical protein